MAPQWQHGIVRAALIEQPGTVTVREVPPPAVDGHALVRVAQAGLCGTDVKIASGQRRDLTTAGAVGLDVPRLNCHRSHGQPFIR